MEIRAAIVDPLPLFRHGAVAALLDAGFAVDEPADIWTWFTESDQHVVLLSLGTPADWQLLADVHAARPDVRFLALLNDPALDTYVRALIGGASGALLRASPPDALRDAFSALVKGQTLLPLAVVAALTGRRIEHHSTTKGSHDTHRDMWSSGSPSPQERDWLGRLASGVTVAHLAQAAGYSERMMFRLLRALYARMGASNRTEALMLARDQGWV